MDLCAPDLQANQITNIIPPYAHEKKSISPVDSHILFQYDLLTRKNHIYNAITRRIVVGIERFTDFLFASSVRCVWRKDQYDSGIFEM